MVQEAEKLKNNCPLSLVVNSITMSIDLCRCQGTIHTKYQILSSSQFGAIVIQNFDKSHEIQIDIDPS